MSPEIILYIILGIIIIDFIFEQWLDYLNIKTSKKDLPEEVTDIYDEDKYKKSISYLRTNTRFSFITSSFSLVLTVIVLSTGLLGWIDEVLRQVTTHPVGLALLYFAVIFIVSDIITLPFQLYSIFVIEEKFEFNKTTPKIFVLDKLKGYLLSAILGGLILGALLYLIIGLGQSFWIVFWVVIAAFILFMNMFYTSLIVPLFNKLTPLEDGDLKNAIHEYCRKVNFPLTNVFVIDGSKRSSKSNAFFSGIGKKKKIVLYDTLMENHSNEELVAVLAHEVGHYKKKHILQGYVLSLLQTGLMLFIMSLLIFNEDLSVALGGSQMAIHLNLIAIGLLYSPVSKLLGILMNIVSRKNEYEADNFASETYRGEALVRALKKLSVDNLSNLYPHRWYVFFHYSHPPLLARLNAIRSNHGEVPE